MLALMERRADCVVNIGSGIARTVVEQLTLLFGDQASFVAEPSRTTRIVADIRRLEDLLVKAAPSR